MDDKLQIIILSSILLAVLILLLWRVNPGFLVSVTAGLVATGIWAYINFFNPMKFFSDSVKLWSNRNEIDPSICKRIKSAKRSLFFVGFSFEGVLHDHSGLIKDILLKNENLEIKMLMLHPDSLHVVAHQDFTDRDIKRNIYEVVNKRLKSLFDGLSPSAQRRLQVRATYYLPRFAARIFDDDIMIINFYLYRSRAHENPVIEIRRGKHEKEFIHILNSLNNIFHIGDDGGPRKPNHTIIENGKWYGLPEN